MRLEFILALSFLMCFSKGMKLEFDDYELFTVVPVSQDQVNFLIKTRGTNSGIFFWLGIGGINNVTQMLINKRAYMKINSTFAMENLRLFRDPADIRIIFENDGQVVRQSQKKLFVSRTSEKASITSRGFSLPGCGSGDDEDKNNKKDKKSRIVDQSNKRVYVKENLNPKSQRSNRKTISIAADQVNDDIYCAATKNILPGHRGPGFPLFTNIFYTLSIKDATGFYFLTTIAMQITCEGLRIPTLVLRNKLSNKNLPDSYFWTFQELTNNSYIIRNKRNLNHAMYLQRGNNTNDYFVVLEKHNLHSVETNFDKCIRSATNWQCAFKLFGSEDGVNIGTQRGFLGETSLLDAKVLGLSTGKLSFIPLPSVFNKTEVATDFGFVDSTGPVGSASVGLFTKATVSGLTSGEITLTVAVQATYTNTRTYEKNVVIEEEEGYEAHFTPEFCGIAPKLGIGEQWKSVTSSKEGFTLSNTKTHKVEASVQIPPRTQIRYSVFLTQSRQPAGQYYYTSNIGAKAEKLCFSRTDAVIDFQKVPLQIVEEIFARGQFGENYDRTAVYPDSTTDTIQIRRNGTYQSDVTHGLVIQSETLQSAVKLPDCAHPQDPNDT